MGYSVSGIACGGLDFGHAVLESVRVEQDLGCVFAIMPDLLTPMAAASSGRGVDRAELAAGVKAVRWLDAIASEGSPPVALADAEPRHATIGKAFGAAR